MQTTSNENCQKLLQKLRQRIMFIEQSNKLGYWELNISQKSMYWSPEMYNIFGVVPRSIHERRFIREHLYSEDISLYKQSLKELLATHQPITVILRIKNNNTILYCQFKASLQTNNTNKIIIGTLQNVDSLVKIMQDLTVAKNKAEQLSVEKSYFYAKISHDLRQPLQALKIFISLLQEEQLTAEQQSLVKKIANSTDNLSFWLDNFLETAKLESGGVQRKDSTFNIADFLSRLCSEYQEIARYKNIKLYCSGANITINSDAVLLERIVRNLLNNALKYTRNTIWLKWYCCQKNIKIIIKDNGIGFDSGIHHELFKAYYQHPQHRKQGTGLGLAIVKELADILNIKISAKSKVGKGAIFILSIPVA